jgi:hypothetical protein
MPDVDPEKLDKLLDDAGVGERTRAKIKKANAGTPASAKPAGHGCATPPAEPAKF